MKKRLFISFLGTVLLLFFLSSCGSSLEKKLPGSWNNGFHTLTFYSDGSYEESLSYGTGTWTILDGDTLKLTDFYGSTNTYSIKNITDDSMTVGDDWIWKKVG